jgi:transcription initiation factor TFIIIB Brf1 subunit/transcription initiation factor TFIIB
MTPFFKDSHGESLVPFKQRLFRRLKYMYDLRTRISGNETNYRALRTLNRACRVLQLPDSVRDRAAYYYQKISKKYDKLKEDSTNHIVLAAACLLFAIREYKHIAPVTIQELVEVFKNMGHRVSVRRVVREITVVKKIVNAKNYVRKSEDYIYRIISAIINSKDVIMQLQSLNIPYDHFKRLLLKETLKLLRSLNFSIRKGRNPYILAVASVYAASKKISSQLGTKRILTQKLVAKLSGVAEYSVRDHYCSLLKKIIEKQGDNKLEARPIQ